MVEQVKDRSKPTFSFLKGPVLAVIMQLILCNATWIRRKINEAEMSQRIFHSKLTNLIVQTGKQRIMFFLNFKGFSIFIILHPVVHCTEI